MSVQPEELLYLPSHEWALIKGTGSDRTAVVGISSFAVEQLTDLVYLALPQVGKSLKKGDEFGEVESVKAVSPLYSPLSGEVLEVNGPLVDNLDLLSTDPYNQGWIMKIKVTEPSEATQLLKYDDYVKQCHEAH